MNPLEIGINGVGMATTGVPWGSIISGGASLLGGLFSNNANAKVAENANQFSAAQADKANAFTAEQNQKQMEFQKEMANSAYQRGTADMIKAGINPMLAYSQGGASVPTGATGVGQQAQAHMYTNQNVVAPAVQAYNNTAQTASNVDRNHYQNRQTTAQTANTDQDTQNKMANEDNTRQTTKNLKLGFEKMLEEIESILEERKRTSAQTDNYKSQAGLNRGYTKKIYQDYDVDKPKQAYGNAPWSGVQQQANEAISTARQARDLFLPFRGR